MSPGIGGQRKTRSDNTAQIMRVLTQISLILFLVTSLWADNHDWPQWRGQSRDGSSEGPLWPQALDEGHLKSIWKVDLDPSYSGPIVQNGLVYTTETANKEVEVVRAYDLATGKEQWKTEWEGAMRVPFFAKSNGSWIRSTPATDGTRLFVAGMRGVLVCLDAKSGSVEWRLDFAEKFGTDLPSFGFVCSPLLNDDAVMVQAGASMVALKKSDGSVLWRSLEDGGGMNGSAFSSPIIRPIDGKNQLLVQTRTELCGLTPNDGAVLWKQKIPAFRGMNILTPTVFQNTIFTATYGGKALGIRLKDKRPETAWETKLQGYMSSPVVIDSHAYLHLRDQRIACVDLRDGTEKWKTKNKFGKYWSMIARGNQILALDEKGILRLISANLKSLQIVSERKLDTKDCWAHVAVSGDRVIVRSLNGLEVFRWMEPVAG